MGQPFDPEVHEAVGTVRSIDLEPGTVEREVRRDWRVGDELLRPAQVVDEVRHHFGDKVCRQVIPRSVRLSEAPSFGQPIITFDPASRGALAYRLLAKEVAGESAA